MAVNNVVYAGNTLIDLRSDTVTPEVLALGVTAHGASGETITGTVPVMGTMDGNKVITLNGNLATDAYTVRFANADGSYTEIGVISLGGAIPLNLQLGQIDSSTGSISTSENYLYSDLIAIEDGKAYTLTCTNCTLSAKVCYYDASQAFISCTSAEPVKVGGTGTLGSGSAVLPMIDGAAYFRVRLYCNWYGDSYADSVALAIAGTVLTSGAKQYTNQIPIAIDTSGNVVTDGALYTDKRWNSSGGQSTATGYFVSGLIPAVIGDMVRIRWPGGGSADNLQIKAFLSDRSAYSGYMSFTVASNPSGVVGTSVTGSDGYQYDLTNGILDFTVAANSKIPSNVAYITVTLYGDPADCIVTINEAIT